MNVPSVFCHIYLYQGIATDSFGLQQRMWPIFGISRHWKFLVLLKIRMFELLVISQITFLDSSLVAGGLEDNLLSSVSVTLQTICLVGGCWREQSVLSHIFWFSSANLRVLRDEQSMLETSVIPWSVCNMFAFAVHSQPIFVQIFLLGFEILLYRYH